jgi:hypothetical protein
MASVLMTRLHLPLLLLSTLALSGCQALLGSAQKGVSQRIEAGVLNNEDPETVAAGLPAYLILVDGLIDGDPANPDLLCTGAQLYGAYAGNLVEPGPRARLLAGKARRYGRRALCASAARFCDLEAMDFDAGVALLGQATAKELKPLSCAGQAWAGAIQADTENWEAIAEIPKVRAIFERIVALDDRFDLGSAHLYLGVLNTLLPPAYGGKPELGKQHFERALELSGGKNLMIPVLFAERYARLTFDRELHDRLLEQALAGAVEVPRLTLINVLAQQRARALQASANDYF